MRKREVIFAPEARYDLLDIETWLLTVTSMRTAAGFIQRVIDACEALEIASERRHGRDDLKSGMRIIGFERRLTIAFAVRPDRVEILRIFRRGRDWEQDFAED